MAKVEAVAIHNRGKYEVRCAKCGKLLLNCKLSGKFKIISAEGVDKSAQNVIIVARCTRNDCKTDNLLILS